MFYCVIVTAAWLVWHLAFGIRVIGRENLPKDRGFVLAPNHISAIDPVFVVIARYWGRRLIIMGKEEIFKVNPILSWMFRNVGVVAVRRGAGDTEMLQGVIDGVRSGRGVLIFPEGTRSKTGQPGRLKSGAFVIASAANVDIVPCRIIYRHTFMRVFSRVRVCFGKPIPAEMLALGEKRSAAKLRQNKRLLLDAWDELYQTNKFPGQPEFAEPPAEKTPAGASAASGKPDARPAVARETPASQKTGTRPAAAKAPAAQEASSAGHPAASASPEAPASGEPKASAQSGGAA